MPDEAKTTFDKNINYLQEEWTDKEIRNFIKQTNNILLRILLTRRCIHHRLKSQNKKGLNQ